MDELIKNLPEDLSVLDVGGGGLHGENTTDALLAHFEDYTGICNQKKEVDVYLARRAEAGLPIPNIIIETYPYDFGRTFDVVVHDLNVESNMRDWEDFFAAAPVRDGGFLITYIMMTDQYGDPQETPQLIRKHWETFWRDDSFSYGAIGNKKTKGWDILAIQREERRKYILWVLMQKTSG